MIREVVKAILHEVIQNLDHTTIPNEKDAFVWFTWVRDSETYVDKLNGRILTITNRDYDLTVGFPYKSAATISAPIGDLDWLANDPDNFWYNSGGTPNEIPVVSLFQEIDYAAQTFNKHQPQILDGNGVEVFEPRIIQTVIYNSIQTGANLTNIQSYFDVPSEDLTAKWVAIDGNDTTGDGSKLTPWLSAVKWNVEVDDGSVVYQKTDPATLFNTPSYLFLSRNNLYTVIGRTEFNSTDASYGLRLRGAQNTIEGLILTTNGPAFPILTEVLDVLSPLTIKRMYINTLTKEVNELSGFFKLIEDCIIKGDSSSNVLLHNGTEDYEITGNLINATSDAYGFDLSNTGTGVISYNKFIGDVVVDMLRVREPNISIIGNTFNALSRRYIDITTGGDAIVNYNNATLHALVGGNAFISSVLATNVICKGNIISTEDNFLLNPLAFLNNINAEIEDNIINKGTSADSGFTSILCSISDAVAKTLTVNNNRVISNSVDDGYLLLIGTDTADGNVGNDSTAVLVSNNYMQGVWDGVSANTKHSLFVGYEKNANVKYNYIYLDGFPIIIEGGFPLTTNDDNTGGVHYNVLFNNARELIIGGVQNVNVYNNTCVHKIMPNDNIGINIEHSNNLQTSDNCEIKNNIVICDAVGVFTAIYLRDSLSNECDYNIYYAKGTLNFKADGSTYTFEQWQALGFDTNSIVLTEEQFNALFTDFDNNDFSLAVGSQAIGNGVTLNAAYDDGLDASTDWGNTTTVPTVVTKQQTAPWDIGAYVS